LGSTDEADSFKIITSRTHPPILPLLLCISNPPTPTLQTTTYPSQTTPISIHTVACGRQAMDNMFLYLTRSRSNLCCIESTQRST
jgi:hypothetical protein